MLTLRRQWFTTTTLSTATKSKLCILKRKQHLFVFLSLRTLSIWHQSLLAKEDGTPLEIGKISCQVPKKWWQTNKQLKNKQTNKQTNKQSYRRTDRQTDGKTGRQTNGRTAEKVSDLLKLSQMFCWNLYYNTVWIQYLITQKRTRIISKTVKQTIFNTYLLNVIVWQGVKSSEWAWPGSSTTVRSSPYWTSARRQSPSTSRETSTKRPKIRQELCYKIDPAWAGQIWLQ